jgi:trehalose transport system permease protein
MARKGEAEVGAGEATAVTTAARPRPRGRFGAWVRRHTFEIVLVAPLLLYVLILTVAPIIDTFRLSFSSEGAGFGTLDTYKTLFDGFSLTHWTIFERAIFNTILVALLSLVLEIGIGLGIAMALHVVFFGRGFVRTVLLVPLGVPTIVSGAVMLLIFQRSGYMNSVMGLFFNLANKIPGVHLTWENISWQVAGGWRTLLTIAIADMWKVLPVITLIFLAGLQSIPQDVYEAADVDGATKWQRFIRVTLPLMIPYFTMALILRAIDAFRIFELALVLAGGVEPVLGTYISSRYLPPVSDPFTSSAASIVLFAIIMIFIVLYLRFVARFQVQR